MKVEEAEDFYLHLKQHHLEDHMAVEKHLEATLGMAQGVKSFILENQGTRILSVRLTV
ncbi:hypothetical protein QUF86_22885 [Peribacillus sp. NJ11]|uniref:hypothetical protein n=1 Tax=Peribacillus sp. NJ11 TaxID=3055861 RepID=UPI0025A2D33B|nr:hypothetical protein [Peribacillus sp. NJ11]MDM5223525.1 hypothetical protein [Peribacillus sp. NJ11]